MFVVGYVFNWQLVAAVTIGAVTMVVPNLKSELDDR